MSFNHALHPVCTAGKIIYISLPYPHILWTREGLSLSKRLPIFYSALLLTGVNLLLRFAGTSFQVYLSGQIGAAGIGLLQLVMSVNGFAAVAGIAGIRTAAMYLTAEELGKKRPENVRSVLSGCYLYSMLFSGGAAAALYFCAPYIADRWLGNLQTLHALRLFACFLPATFSAAYYTNNSNDISQQIST